jgi:hypothetical protein
MSLPFEAIASPKSCNGITKYPILKNGDFSMKTPAHVKGALVFNRHLKETKLDKRYPKIRDGEKIRYCPLIRNNPLRCDIISAPNSLPKEWGLEKYLDRRTHFEKTLIKPLDSLVCHGGWTARPIATLDLE